MRRLYDSLNRKRRAEQHRKDAQECDLAGFPEIARVNYELADLLDPPVVYDEDY